MTHNCRTCDALFTPRKSQLAKGDYICKPCWAIYSRDYRRARRDRGLPMHFNRERRALIRKIRDTRPEVKLRRAEQMMGYSQDPRLSKRHVTRSAARKRVLSGKIQRKACSVCGNINSEMHHEDYGKPFEVVWYCKPHHLAVHHTTAQGE